MSIKRSATFQKVLVTGASGLVGKSIVAHLLEQGYQVRALVRQPNTYFEYHPNLEVVIGDLNTFTPSNLSKQTITNQRRSRANSRRTFFHKLCQNMDVIIHLAAAKNDEITSYQVNVVATQQLLNAAKIANVQLWIQFSTLSTKIEKLGRYAQTKLQADQAVMASGVPYLILRPSIIYGNFTEGVFGSLAKFGALPVVPFFGDGTQVVQPIHVQDVAQVVTRCLRQSHKVVNRVYDLAGVDAVTLNQLLPLIKSHLLTRPIEPAIILHLPTWLGLGLAHTTKLFFKKPPFTVSNVLGSTQHIPIEESPLHQAVQYQPARLQAGLSKLIPTSPISKEIQWLWKYATQNFEHTSPPTTPDLNLIEKAWSKNHASTLLPKWWRHIPGSLGAADLFSKMFQPSSLLQRKLLVMMAVLETSPVFAQDFLPSNFTVWQVTTHVFKYGWQLLRSSASLVLLFPFLIRSINHAEKV